jgi:hypothetical protein
MNITIKINSEAEYEALRWALVMGKERCDFHFDRLLDGPESVRTEAQIRRFTSLQDSLRDLEVRLSGEHQLWFYGRRA